MPEDAGMTCDEAFRVGLSPAAAAWPNACRISFCSDHCRQPRDGDCPSCPWTSRAAMVGPVARSKQDAALATQPRTSDDASTSRIFRSPASIYLATARSELRRTAPFAFTTFAR